MEDNEVRTDTGEEERTGEPLEQDEDTGESGETVGVESYQTDLTPVVESLAVIDQRLQRIDGDIISNIAVTSVLVGVVLGVAVSRYFMTLWRA